MSNMVELLSKTIQLWCQKQLSKLSWDLASLDPSHEMLGYRMIKLGSKLAKLGSKLAKLWSKVAKKWSNI